MWNQRMQMGWQWKKDQEKKKRQQEEEARRQAAQAASILAGGESGAPTILLAPPFAKVEEQVKKLRRDLAARKINEKQFQDKARALMIEDKQGTWWMVGSESGTWYRHDSAGWTQATPPGSTVGSSSSPGTSAGTTLPQKRDPAIVRLWNAAFTFVFAVAIFGGVGFGLGEYLDHGESGIPPILCAGAVWFFGLWYSFRAARSQWRR